MKIYAILVSLLLLNACGGAQESTRNVGDSQLKVRKFELAQEGTIEESFQIARSRKDEDFTDEEVASLCKESAEDRKQDRELLETQVEEIIHTKTCYKRNFQGTCYKWFRGVRVTCGVLMKEKPSGEKK